MSVSSTPDVAEGGKGLKGGALGLLGSVVVGVASTAPAYSLAASLGYVVVTANGDGIIGVKAPLIMILAFGLRVRSVLALVGWAAGESSPPTSS